MVEKRRRRLCFSDVWTELGLVLGLGLVLVLVLLLLKRLPPLPLPPAPPLQTLHKRLETTKETGVPSV